MKTPLVVWVGFAAWACFYAVGGGTKGLVTILGSVGSGVVWGFLIVLVWKNVSATSMALLGLCVGIGAFLMCVPARLPILSLIPGAFVGAAAYFASALLSVIGGSLLAFISERGADVIERRFGLPAGDPAQLGGAHSTPAHD